MSVPGSPPMASRGRRRASETPLLTRAHEEVRLRVRWSTDTLHPLPRPAEPVSPRLERWGIRSPTGRGSIPYLGP